MRLKLNEEIETFLRNYRNMPHTEEQIIPAHVVFSFKPRTALSIFDRNIRKNENEFRKESEKPKLKIKKKENSRKTITMLGSSRSAAGHNHTNIH
jgi:hypothetical protein